MVANISVVIVSYYTGPVLRRCIESTLRANDLKELIIVNNGNPDAVIDYIKSLNDKRVTLVTGHGNIGFGAGCNAGASIAKGDAILFLNPDCIIHKNTLTELYETLEEHEDAWLASATLVNVDGTLQGCSKRNLLTPLTAATHTFMLHKLGLGKPLNLPESLDDKKPVYVEATTGAVMLVRASKWEEIGGFDENYFLHVEDLDLCKTIFDKGGRIIVNPAVHVVHVRSSSEVPSRFVEKQKVKSFFYYLNKHFSRSKSSIFLTLVKLAVIVRYWFKSLSIAFSSSRKKKKESIKQWRATKAMQTPVSYEAYKFKDNKKPRKTTKFLVTGATGNLGIHVLRYLLAGGYEVIATYHETLLDFSHPNITWVHADLNTGYIDLEGATVDVVVHAASLWHLPQHLSLFAGHGAKRLIAFSSTSIEGKAGSVNDHESKLVNRLRDAEAEMKAACEKHGIDYTLFHPTLIYGHGMDQNVSNIMKFVDRFGVFPVHGMADGLREPVHVGDLARAVVSVVQNPATYNNYYTLSGGETLPYREMVERVFTILGKRPRIINFPALPALMDVAGKVLRKPWVNGEIAKRMNQDLAFDHAKATEEFGYAPRKFLEEGIEDMGGVTDSNLPAGVVA